MLPMKLTDHEGMTAHFQVVADRVKRNQVDRRALLLWK